MEILETPTLVPSSSLALPSRPTPKPVSPLPSKSKVVAIAKAKQCFLRDAKRKAKAEKAMKKKAEAEATKKGCYLWRTNFKREAWGVKAAYEEKLQKVEFNVRFQSALETSVEIFYVVSVERDIELQPIMVKKQ